MKKFLAAVMAAAMVVSMTAVASFAAVATKATATADISLVAGTASTAPILTVTQGTGTTVWTGAALDGTHITNADVITALKAGSITTPGAYTFKGIDANGIVTFEAIDAKLQAAAGIASAITPSAVTTATVSDFVFTNGTDATSLDSKPMEIVGPFVEGTGDMANNIVRPGKTMYYTINQFYAANKDFIKLTLTKGDGSKNIESVKLVEKKFDNELVLVADSSKETGSYLTTTSAKNRQYFVAVKLRDNMKDSEFKVNFKVKASAKKDIKATDFDGAVAAKSGDAIAEKTYDSAWVNNETITGSDNEFLAGKGGVMSKPVKDDNNTVTWVDANRTLATMEFTADSAVTVFYPKLSTVWDNEFYGMHFTGKDAFKFEFVGNPTISATARPVLKLMNPFINSDDEYEVDAADLIVYELVDGALVLATDRFTATEDDDGNQVLVTKTRTLGTYVVASAEADEAMDAAEVVAPEKIVPNTGR